MRAHSSFTVNGISLVPRPYTRIWGAGWGSTAGDAAGKVSVTKSQNAFWEASHTVSCRECSEIMD